jgi:hypothetical protein
MCRVTTNFDQNHGLMIYATTINMLFNIIGTLYNRLHILQKL